MSKSKSHKNAQIKAAGKNGTTEVKIKGHQRLDAANRLKKSEANQKILQVPQKDMKKAVEAMKKVGVKGSVKNMTGTKRYSV